MSETLKISKESIGLINFFGALKNTYDQKLQLIYKLTIKEQLREFLMSSDNTIPIDEAIARAEIRKL